MTKRFALRHPNYDGKGNSHILGCNFYKQPEDLNDARTWKSPNQPKATNEYKFWGYEIIPVNVTVEEIIE